MTIESKLGSRTTIIVRDLPNASKIESSLRIYGTNTGELSVIHENMLSEFSKTSFGIGLDELNFSWPEIYGDLPKDSFERCAIDDEFNEHEDKFETSYLSPDDAVPLLIAHGVDFTDAFGSTMLCTKYLMRQAEAAAKGLAGHLPNMQEIATNKWASSIANDAAKFKAQRQR